MELPSYLIPAQPTPPFPIIPTVSNRTAFVSPELIFWHSSGFILSGCDIATVDVSAGEYTQPTLQNFENELTKRRAKNLLEACNLYPLLYPTKIQCPPRQATPEEVELVHSPEYVAKMLASSQTPGDAGSYAHYGPGSTHIALTSVASAIDATEAVIKGEIDNA